jgi:nicotinamidase-related amidase
MKQQNDAHIDSPQSLPNWVLPWPTFQVDWRRAALLVIDYQNYSSNPETGTAKMLLEKMPTVAAYYVPRITEVTLPNTRRLLEAFRKAKRERIFTRHGAFLPDGRDFIARRRAREQDNVQLTGAAHLFPRGSYEHEIVDSLRPWPGELIVDKNSTSPFHSTGIDQILRNLGVETLVVTGMATEMCVESTSRDAADRGYNVIVVEDAVATFFPEHHRGSLSALARVFAQVWSTSRVLSSFQEFSSGDRSGS